MINVSINTSPTSEINIFSELHLVKSILPYADKIKLYSPIAYMILTMISYAGLSDKEKTEFILAIISQTDSQFSADTINTLMQKIELLRKKKHKTPDDIIGIKKFEKTLTKMFQEYEKMLERLFESSGFSELSPLFEQNIIEFQPYDIVGGDIGNEIMEHLKSILSNPSEYPLFDEGVNSLVKSAIGEGIINIDNQNISRSQHIELVSNFMDRLPSFDQLPTDEILDIRKELQNPLVRFRAAIQEFSEQINEVPWSKGFRNEADSLYLKNIEPALIEIEEKLQANKYFQTLILKSLNKTTAVSFSPLLGLGITNHNNLLSIAFASIVFRFNGNLRMSQNYICCL